VRADAEVRVGRLVGRGLAEAALTRIIKA